ncbi:MAG: ATP-binding protein [Methylococcales bacterium]|nr:ATP-binding protein [Methylococcales bacterium]MCK5898895.1 ATP-binding protein [Methylococcales bacterium]
MTLDELLNMDESPKLDFKQIWKQDDVNGEYIKDILSLANGNPQHMNEDAYLVFGVSDDKQSIHDISDERLFHPTKYPDLLKLKAYLLTTLNNFSTPTFLGLHLEFIESEGGRVLLITIPPHPYLLSLSKDLTVKNRTDKKGTVYYRIGNIH